MFDSFAHQEFAAIISELSLAELLSKPFPPEDIALADFYVSQFGGSSVFSAGPVTLDCLMAAGRLRAAHPGLKLPDAIHLATAGSEGCTVFLSGDRRLPSLQGLHVFRLGPGMLDEIRQLNA